MAGEPKLIDWDHVYLLAWWGEDGRSYLSTWAGDLPEVFCVVTGLGSKTPPLWTAKVPDGAQLHELPSNLTHEERLAVAKRRGGLLALGWYIEAGVGERGKPRQDPVFA